MRIGLLSDVHSNLPALQAVLSDLRQTDVLICAGDILGYYADANEVCETLRYCNAMVIRGNHDAYVLGISQPKSEHGEAYRTEWTQKILTPENHFWLASLPNKLIFHWHQYTIRVCHASPWDEETYLYKNSPALRNIALARDHVLILGHTHHPMYVKCGEGFIINPGSVGQPRDWLPGASYAIFHSTGKVEFRRASYDIARLQQRLRDSGWQPTMVDILSRSRNVFESGLGGPES
jgi:putative phosphoesterase